MVARGERGRGECVRAVDPRAGAASAGGDAAGFDDDFDGDGGAAQEIAGARFENVLPDRSPRGRAARVGFGAAGGGDFGGGGDLAEFFVGIGGSKSAAVFGERAVVGAVVSRVSAVRIFVSEFVRGVQWRGRAE